MDAVIAGAVMAVHFAFLVYVAAGGFLAWRWPRWIVPHLAAAAWGLASVSVGLACPLTRLENHFRQRARRATLDRGGFIDHYLEGVVYPERYTVALWAAAGALVLASWVGAGLRRHGRGGSTGDDTVREGRRVSPSTLPS